MLSCTTQIGGVWFWTLILMYIIYCIPVASNELSKLASGTMMGLPRHWVHLFTIPQVIAGGKLLSHNRILKSTNNWNHPISHFSPIIAPIKSKEKNKVNNLNRKFHWFLSIIPWWIKFEKHFTMGWLQLLFTNIWSEHLQCLFGTSRSGSIDRWHWRLGAWEISRGIERDLSITSRKTWLGSSGFHRQWSKFQDNKYNNKWDLKLYTFGQSDDSEKTSMYCS